MINASHLKCPPSEPWILRINDYLRSKTDERRQVAESSSLISRIEKSGSRTTVKGQHRSRLQAQHRKI